MTTSRPPLRASPFHARAAANNRDNAWVTRNGMTLSAWYDDVNAEALAARLNVVIVDISWRWRIAVEGAGAETFLARLLTRDPAILSPGQAFKALWLTDEGGVRGAGALARFGRESFLLVSASPDVDWLSLAAQGFDLRLRDLGAEMGGLAVIGPYARATLDAAGVASDLVANGFRGLTWQGIELVVSRWGEHEGYEIWCEPDDGLLLWDRLMRAGAPFGVTPCGVAAADVLDLEAGIARPHLDWQPARTATDADPRAAELGLTSLVDPGHHRFNGHRAIAADKTSPRHVMIGVEIASDEPAPFTPLLQKGEIVGHTLRSAYSPSLRRAIALARVHPEACAATALSLTLPPGLKTPILRQVDAQVVALPFLKPPVDA